MLELLRYQGSAGQSVSRGPEPGWPALSLEIGGSCFTSGARLNGEGSEPATSCNQYRIFTASDLGHSVGVLDDGVLFSLTPHKCNVLFEPKVDSA